MGWFKRAQAPVVSQPQATEGLIEAFRSAAEAMRSAHKAELDAIRAEIAALNARIEAHEELAAHLKTRMNSLTGLVNRKVGEPERAPTLQTPQVHVLGAAVLGMNGGGTH